jgi:ribose 5-phosphate isomerase B
MGDPSVMAADHRGSSLKDELRERLEAEGHVVVDKGTFGEDSVDYPDYAAAAARAVASGEVPRGILVCGTGLGVMYTANRFPGVRAAWVQDEEMARMSRLHNDANMIAMPGDRLDIDQAWPIVKSWLETSFEGGRHQRRVEKIDELTSAAARTPALDRTDPEIAHLLRAEAKRQADGLELIASENFVSEAVRTSTRRATPGDATTAAVRWWTKSRPWRSSAPRSSSGPTTRTCSPTPVPRPTKRFTAPFAKWATPCSP